MKRAHFFDINTILRIDSKPWIVDKNNPNIPIMKISESDFNLMKNGIYKSQGNKISFNGRVFWISDDLSNKIKIKSKNHGSDFSNLAISMQEYINSDVIKNLTYQIVFDNISHIKNTTDDIYIICSKNSKRNYDDVIKKLELELNENGLNIKNYYFISETFYNRNSDDISYKKNRLLLQHLIGLKTDVDKFTDQSITKYNEINFYDDDQNTINLSKNINKIFSTLLNNSNDTEKQLIRENLKNDEPILTINQVTYNKSNRFIKNIVEIEWSNIIKSFEGFNN